MSQNQLKISYLGETICDSQAKYFFFSTDRPTLLFNLELGDGKQVFFKSNLNGSAICLFLAFDFVYFTFATKHFSDTV